jgi:ATP-dependent DNA helicase DinG
MAIATLPPPCDLGFPAKFSSWYEDQITAIDKVVFNKLRFTALGMPTGSGKSVTGIAAALLHGKVERALYLTSTKGLQDQLAQDFQDLGLIDVRGQRNYPCIALEAGAVLDRYRRGSRRAAGFVPGCDEGPCHSGVKCPYAPVRGESHVRPDCLSYGALWDARRAPLVSANYAMYLTSEEYSEGLGTFDLLLLDEAHDADKELEAFLVVEVTVEDCATVQSKLLKINDVVEWKKWAMHHVDRVRVRLEARQAMPPQDPEGARELKRLKDVYAKLQRLCELRPTDWVCDLDGMRARFAPTKVSPYAEQYLFRGIPHVVLMSATMTRKTTQLLGIDPNQMSFWEAPSKFPINRRPVISVNPHPPVRVDMRMHEDTKFMLMRRVDRLIEDRRALGWKGIIHCVSYARMKEILASSEHKDIMLTHDAGGTRETIRQFKERPGPLVLVSPSIMTGYDFPHDECRYQIILKVPMPDMRDAIMQIRKELDAEYAGYLAMQKLVQGCGRGMRGPDDWCETLVVDDHFADWWFKRYRKHAPRWFVDAVQYVDVIPEPLDV